MISQCKDVSNVCMSPSVELSRTAEAVVTESRRIGAGAADNHVVEEFNIDGLRRLPELPSHLHIGRARRRVAGRVIVNTYNSRRGLLPHNAPSRSLL